MSILSRFFPRQLFLLVEKNNKYHATEVMLLSSFQREKLEEHKKSLEVQENFLEEARAEYMDTWGEPSFLRGIDRHESMMRAAQQLADKYQASVEEVMSMRHKKTYEIKTIEVV